MDATRSHVTIYNVTPAQAEDFAFDYETRNSDLVQQLVPNNDDWGGIGWIELEEYEYNPHTSRMHLTLETQWAPPTEWLRNASVGTHYFENRLITMATIQKSEACVTGIALLDGEVMQNKPIFELDAAEVGRYYDDEQPQYDLNYLDHQIWDSIEKFVTVCEQFYLEGNEKND